MRRASSLTPAPPESKREGVKYENMRSSKNQDSGKIVCAADFVVLPFKYPTDLPPSRWGLRRTFPGRCF